MQMQFSEFDRAVIHTALSNSVNRAKIKQGIEKMMYVIGLYSIIIYHINICIPGNSINYFL